jgi:hypothetical protein
MEPATPKPRTFEFCFIHLDYTLVRVEEDDNGRVTIRATADTFSKRRKLSFIRELVAEGFIADDRWISRYDGEPDSPGIRWLVDWSWVKPDRSLSKRNHRWVKRWLLPIAAVWLVFIYLVAAGETGTRPSGVGTGAPKAGAYGSR